MEKAKTIGQAIDQILDALHGLDPSARTTVLTAVSSHLGFSIPSTAIPVFETRPQADTPQSTQERVIVLDSGQTQRAISNIDIRSFKQEKKPDSANQMACVVAFYLQEVVAEPERKEVISSEDLEKYFKQAGFPLPGNTGQVLRDCKRAGYFETTSRGLYKLNAVGYNLVAHKLPKVTSQ